MNRRHAKFDNYKILFMNLIQIKEMEVTLMLVFFKIKTWLANFILIPIFENNLLQINLKTTKKCGL